MDPVSLPLGASPDCSDVTFLPGGVSSRPAFQKIFASPVYPGYTMVYGKSFVDPKGTIRNLYLYSNGGMTVELPAVTPGVEVALLDNSGNPVFLPPGSYMKSITAFGREWLAPADGLHGTDIPLQYDGTYIDRVTQDGPGTSPEVSSIIIPPTDIGTSTSTITLAIVELDPENVDPSSGFFTSINLYTNSSVSSVQVGQFIDVLSASGTTHGSIMPFIGNWGPITAIFTGSPNLIQVSAYIPSGTVYWTGTGTASVETAELQRLNNIVYATTTTPHQLLPGYQVQITNAQATQVGDSVSTPTDTTIVIDNENLPGLATITVGLASGQTSHGLLPGNQVYITGVKAATIGTSISTIVRAAQVTTVVMTTATGLQPGAIVTISGVTPSSFNGIWTVVNVSTTTNPNDTFTYAQVDVDATGSGGSTAINWPDSNPNDLYTVVASPTDTSFQVAIGNYSDGTWTTGSITFGWNGKFLVQTVSNPATPGGTDYESFTYQQYGPNATAVAVSGNIIASPYGQAAPGQHQMQCFFITRQGYTTAPSPPVDFVANGGQFIRVTNIPIGPSNVVARAIAFTGSQGAYFFYIPTQPQINGQIAGTSTVINDNTTTNAVFDFGDPTLFSALGISISGNNLANQIILDGALGFGFYGSRLFAYGQRNTIQNLLNMGFDGGYLPNASTLPTGWSGGGAGSLQPGHYGDGWQVSSTPLTQSMYLDSSGAPIANANDKYSFRAWISGSGTVTATISSVTTSFSSTVTLTASAAGFLQGNFSLPMPSSIPSDLIIGITGTNSVVVDEMSIIFTSSPYLTGMFSSYVNNPEGMDGVSGVIGPEDDTHQVMDLGIIRDNLYILTQDPSGRLHQTSQGLSEPSEWTVSEVAANCGTVSAYSGIRSQADDSSAAGGEEFWGWYSSTGIRLFSGQEPYKISQEIQRPIGQKFPGAPNDLGALNTAAQLTVWGLNDPQSKTMWWGIPSVSATAPNVIYMLSYLGLDSAESIASSPPVHRSLSGSMVANDLARKWAPWQRTMNGAALMYRNGTDIQPVFFAGNGVAPGVGGHSNAYILNPNQYTDDDYGLIQPYYTTAAFPDKLSEQAYGLGGAWKMLSFMAAMFYGVGYMNIEFFVGYLNNSWPLTGQYLMSLTPLRSAPFGCGQATGDCMFIKFYSTPNASGSTPSPSTDNQFSLSRLSIWIRKNARYLTPGIWP